MKRTFIRSLGMVLVLGVVCGGFYGGRLLGVDPHAHAARHSQSWLLSLSKGLTGGLESSLTDGSSDVPPAEIFKDVLDKVQNDFVETGNNVEDAPLTDGALTRMLASLDDPDTYYLNPSARKVRQETLQGRFQGIGAVTTIVKTKKRDVDYRYLTIVSVMPGSPAEKAGLQPGDRINEVNGHWIIAYSVVVDYDRIAKETRDEAVRHDESRRITDKFNRGYTVAKALPILTAGQGRQIRLTIERNNQPPFQVALTTATTQVDPVEYKVLNGHVGYLHVRQFNPQAADAMTAALGARANDLQGMVVDLRGNPGGVRADTNSGVDGYQAALTLVKLLTSGGTIAHIERRPNQRQALTLSPPAKPFALTLAVLVDEGTANLAEMVAAALRDNGKAKIIGTHTFGDDVLEMFAVLKGGGGINLTAAHLFTATGVDLNKGVQPDIVATTAESALQRALATLGVRS